MSIKQKIILSFFAVALSIVLLGGVIFFHHLESAEQIATHEATNIAKLFMSAVLHELEETNKPLSDPQNRREFQNYIERYKSFQHRDVVIVDLQQQIVADTIAAEVGTLFGDDKNDEVGQTLKDGTTRFFIEKNAHYPLGIKQMAVPFNNNAGERLGAIILEYTPLYNEIMTGIKREARVFIWMFAAVLLFAFMVGRHLYGNISGSLSSLMTAALAIANGKLDTRIGKQRPDEFGLLTDSFNAMAEKLQQSHEELRQSHRMLENEKRHLKLSEEALKRSETTLRALFESAKDGIFQLSPQGEILSLNESFAAMHGYTVDEMLKMSLRDLDTPESAQLAPGRMQKVLAGEKLTFEVEHYGKNGQTIPLEVSVSMVCINDEKSLWGFHRDITERRQAAQEREALGERLRQAQKMEAIGTLSGGIAHDFNNILSAITGFSHLALMHAKDDNSWPEDIRQVLKAAERATDLVRQILTFSRKQPHEKSPIQISVIVQEAVKLLRASIPATIDIRQEITSQAVALADSTQIHQVIMNLCTNAYHSMMEGGGTLGIRLRETVFDQAIVDSDTVLPPGRYVALSISDTGCGMGQETMAKIFEPYFTTKETGKGTGLGLAVVYGIVKSHQGLISVDSELGHGTTFTVSLPIIVYEAANEPIEIAPPMAKAHERVMVVDDESDIRKYTSLFLAEAGYQTKSFSDGLDAWHAFSQAPDAWDLIITDKTMPKMTGEQLTAKVLEIRPDLPIIICSGYNNALVDGEAAKTAGIFSYLQKPVKMNLLLSLVAQALTKNK